MTQTVFKRYEKKYMLTDGQYEALRQQLAWTMRQDAYGKQTICSVYYDTEDYRLIRASIEKPVYKEKLRMRSYGIPGKGDTVFVELKKKYKGEVYKRRIALPLAEAEGYLLQGLQPGNAGQISREIDWFMAYYAPQPRVYLACDRLALFGKDDPELRITFDTDIRWRREALSLGAGDWGYRQLPKGLRLMELKVSGAMPLWLADTLNGLGIFPVSYSKYGTCYKENLVGNLALEGKGAIRCA